MKWLLRIAGAALVLMGGFWFLQGVNIIPVGFMAGHIQYALLGIAVVVVGIGLVWVTIGRKGAPTT